MKGTLFEESSQTFGHLLLPLPSPMALTTLIPHGIVPCLPAPILWGLFTMFSVVISSYLQVFLLHLHTNWGLIFTWSCGSNHLTNLCSIEGRKIVFFFLRCRASMKCIGLNLFELTALHVPWGISQDDDSFGQSALYLSTLSFCLWSVLRPPPGIFADSPTSCWIF